MNSLACALRSLALGLLLCAASGLAQTNLITLAPDGAWTWYNDPRALFHNGALYFGFVRSDGASALSALDLQTGAINNLWTSTWRQYDDHDNSGLLRLQDGRLLAIYARHGSANTFSYRLSLSANPTSPGAWEAERTSPNTGTGLTYSNPYQLAAEAGKVYDYCRDLNFNPTVLTSTDAGATWSAPQPFIKTGTGSTRPYVKYCSDYNRRIDFLYTDGHPRDVNNSLYHAYYQAGAFYYTDGTFLKSFSALPLLHDSGERATVIYQYSDTPTSDYNDHIPSGRAWCWEITYQTNGWPACVFTVQRDSVAASDWTGDRIYYYYARWTGTNWQKRFIAQAGRPLYSSEDDYAGGIALDPEDPTVVYIATDAANPFDLTTISNVTLAAHYELFKGITTNGGLSFTWSALTTNSSVDNFRPYVPRNRQGMPALIWFRGNYPTFTSFTTEVVGLFTNVLPRAGLLADWPLDAVTGSTTPDLSHGNNLSLYGSPGPVAGVISNAFTFNGSSQYLNLAHETTNAAGLPVYQQGRPFTVAFWVRGAAQTAKFLLAEGNPTNNGPLFLLQSGQFADANTKLDVYLRTTGGAALVDHIVSTRPVFDGSWHHVAYADNAGAVQVYVDGIVDTNFTYTPSGAFNLLTTSLGALVRSTTNGYFNGNLDDVLVWTRVLSAAEVQSVMTHSLPPLPPPQPPTITYQSPGSTNALGDYVTFSAQVLGDPPFSFQWLKNGTPLPGQTNSSLLLPSTVSGSNGFALRVTSPGGSVTGAPIPFVVLPDPAPDVAAGLLSRWPFDSLTNGSGAAASPDLYSGNDMLLNGLGSTNLVAGQFGQALFLNGGPQYAVRSGGFPIYLTTNYTVSFWVKGASGQTNKQVFAEGGAGGNFFLLGTENANPYGGALNVKVNPGLADTRSTRVVFDGAWHHLVWVDQNGKARLFVDGALDATDYSYTRANPALETTAVGCLVRTSPANFFAGAVDDLLVWDRALTYSEITQVAVGNVPSARSVAPTIFSQPADQVSGVYAGDSPSFSVLASGSSPLHYQWLKNGVDISPQTNPSAAGSILTLANAQAADAGSYCVVITNTAGAVTSRMAQLAVITYTPITSGVALQLDVDFTGSPNTQDGFQAFTLGANAASFSNAVTVTLSPIGGATLAERLRNSAPQVVDNPPALTQAHLYNDFAFASSTTDGAGLSVQISHLLPNTPYGVTLWSFDPQSPGARTSDWSETTSGTPLPITTGYTFNGSSLPTADYDYTFGAVLTSSPAGQLQIQGVRHGGTSYGVFLNGLRLVANPVLRFTGAQRLASGKLQLAVELQFPGQSIAFQQSPGLNPPHWTGATALNPQVHGLFMTVEFPTTSGLMFYRALGP
jgi:hypothetical protein